MAPKVIARVLNLVLLFPPYHDGPYYCPTDMYILFLSSSKELLLYTSGLPINSVIILDSIRVMNQCNAIWPASIQTLTKWPSLKIYLLHLLEMTPLLNESTQVPPAGLGHLYISCANFETALWFCCVNNCDWSFHHIHAMLLLTWHSMKAY